MEREDRARWARLQRYYDGEATPAERADVEAWLARDPVAAAALAELRRLGEALREALPSAPPDLKGRILGAVRRAHAPVHPLLTLVPVMRRLAAAAAAAAAVLLGALLLRGGQREPPAGEETYWVAVSPPGWLEGADLRFRQPRPEDLFR